MDIKNTFKTSPKGYYMYFKELLKKDMKGVKFAKRIYVIKHYILFSYLTNNDFQVKIIKDNFNKLLYTLLFLPGIIKSRKF